VTNENDSRSTNEDE
jgi:hypothetical protein